MDTLDNKQKEIITKALEEYFFFLRGEYNFWSYDKEALKGTQEEREAEHNRRCAEMRAVISIVELFDSVCADRLTARMK